MPPLSGDATKGLPNFFVLLFYKPLNVGEFRLYSPGMDGPQSLLHGKEFSFTNEDAMARLFELSPDLAVASLTIDMGDTRISEPELPPSAPIWSLDTSRTLPSAAYAPTMPMAGSVMATRWPGVSSMYTSLSVSTTTFPSESVTFQSDVESRVVLRLVLGREGEILRIYFDGIVNEGNPARSRQNCEEAAAGKKVEGILGGNRLVRRRRDNLQILLRHRELLADPIPKEHSDLVVAGNQRKIVLVGKRVGIELLDLGRRILEEGNGRAARRSPGTVQLWRRDDEHGRHDVGASGLRKSVGARS